MGNILDSLKDNFATILTTALFTLLGTLLINISSEAFPIILPLLQKLSFHFYLRIITLLTVLLIVSLVLLLVLFSKLKLRQPRMLKGKSYGLRWECEISYNKKLNDIEVTTWFYFLCPKHETHLGRKDANVPNCAYHELYCRKCDKVYTLTNKGTPVYLEDAESLLRNQILISKINLPNTLK